MHDCKYCTNYFLKNHLDVNNCCMGHEDRRKPYFRVTKSSNQVTTTRKT